MSQSVQLRLAFSVTANLFKSVMSFMTGMIVARGLGPEHYGSLMFLLATFTALRGLLDMGSSSAFFTFLSQRQRSRTFILWYFIWLGIQFIATLLAVGVLFPKSWIELFWLEENRGLILLAFLAVFIQSTLWTTVQQMGEAQRITRWVQGISALVAIVHFALILIMFELNWLTLEYIFLILILEWITATLILFNKLIIEESDKSEDSVIEIIRQYWIYCLPLIPYTWISFAYDYSDRWFMQSYGGSAQQGFYAISIQFGSVAAIATVSILNIFWKEIAEASYRDDFVKVAKLYKKTTNLLMVLASAVAGLLIPWSESILRVTVGDAFLSAAIPFAIMLLYPIHQCIGQINGAMAYATGQISRYTYINIVSMTLSIILTYYLLADSDAPIPGLGLGAIGLAAKMIVIQFLTVNVFRLYLSKKFNFKFDLMIQLKIISVYLIIGFVIYYSINMVIMPDFHELYKFVLAALLYLISIIIIGVSSPQMMGVDAEDMSFIKEIIGQFYARIASRI